MAILLAYEGEISDDQKNLVIERLEDYISEISQLSFHPESIQLVLNNSEITAERGQEVLDVLVELINPHSWGTDLPIRLPKRNQPPEVYALRYEFAIPYDPLLH